MAILLVRTRYSQVRVANYFILFYQSNGQNMKNKLPFGGNDMKLNSAPKVFIFNSSRPLIQSYNSLIFLLNNINVE